MAAIGLFSGTEFFYAGAILLEMGGALSLWLGWRTRAGAAALILFLIPATMIFHRTSMSFLLDATVQDQQFHVMKNLVIFGGLAYVVAYGAGPISPDARRTLHRDGRKGTGDWPHLEKYPSQRPGADGFGSGRMRLPH